MRKHGMTGTRIYQTWKSMRQRCNYKQGPKYKDYGGRGITYCTEWEDFTNFYGWALESGYTDQLTLDRINNDGNYCPENCQWLTLGENKSKEQIGTNNAQCKITAEIVKAIRKNFNIPQKVLAKKYNISVAQVSRIRNRKAWRHI